MLLSVGQKGNYTQLYKVYKQNPKDQAKDMI